MELNTESIRDKAKIYTKANLNDYQKCVYSASADLCMRNPALLLGKKDLFKLAQEKVYQDGYQYKGKVDQSAIPCLKMTSSLRDPNWIPLPGMKG